eukprot:1330478-Pleurochrysis_carterae.AAC.3
MTRNYLAFWARISPADSKDRPKTKLESCYHRPDINSTTILRASQCHKHKSRSQIHEEVVTNIYRKRARV